MKIGKKWFNKIIWLISGLLLSCYIQCGYAGNEMESFLEKDSNDRRSLSIDRAKIEQSPSIITPVIAEKIIEVLSGPQDIYYLELRGWSFEPGMLQLILNSKSVAKISFVDNEINDTDAQAISEMIIKNKRLIELNLQGCRITTNGLSIIARAYMNNERVIINLNFVSIDPVLSKALLNLKMRNEYISILIRDMQAEGGIKERLTEDAFILFMGNMDDFAALLNRVLTPTEVQLINMIREIQNNVTAQLDPTMQRLVFLQPSEAAATTPLCQPLSSPSPASALMRLGGLFGRMVRQSSAMVTTPLSVSSMPTINRAVADGDQEPARMMRSLQPGQEIGAANAGSLLPSPKATEDGVLLNQALTEPTRGEPTPNTLTPQVVVSPQFNRQAAAVTTADTAPINGTVASAHDQPNAQVASQQQIVPQSLISRIKNLKIWSSSDSSHSAL